MNTKEMPMRVLLTTKFILFFGLIAPAYSHAGHIGELAGHAHWVGVAAVLGVAGLAAILTGNKKGKTEETAEEDAEATEEVGETA
jgi:hypothetical protein